MAKIINTLTGTAPWAHITIKGLQAELRLKAASIKEQLSQPSTAIVKFASPNPSLGSNEILGLAATITIDGTDTHPGRDYHGHINQILHTGYDRNFSHYELTVVSAIAFMDKRTNVRIYQQQNEISIIKSLLQEHNISAAEYSLMGKYPARDYCVQYNETDLAFIQRLMSEAGIYSHISHNKDSHTLHLKEPLIKSHNFWQRQKPGIKAWSCRKAHCLANGHNAESGFLAKPRRARLQAIISVVALLVNAISIPCEARLRYDGL